MPKISNATGASYAGHEGIVEDAQNNLHQLHPVRTDAEVAAVPGDVTVSPTGREVQEQAEGMRAQQEQDDVATEDSRTRGQDTAGGAPSGGTSSSRSSAQRAQTETKK